MKSYSLGLTNNVVGSYDQTKTTLQGRVSSKSINSQTVLGPPLTQFIDVFTEAAITPTNTFISPNGRIFVITAITTGSCTIALYNFNLTTGVRSYVGKATASFANTAATTHTIRGFKVFDSGTSGWKILIATTGSVLINGGLYMINNAALADFTPIISVNYAFATGNNQKAMYLLQDPSNIGVNQLNTATAGISINLTNSKVYVHNGVSATHQYYVYDASVSPTYTTATVTITIATPGVVTYNSHPYLANDPIVFSTTGALPTGLTAGTVYFVRNPTANTFEVSATSGGASINTTGAQSGTHTVGRAFGTTGSNFSIKTGNLPALAGTLLANNSEYYAMPSHTGNSGQDCVFFATTSNLYLGLLSELTSGATTWPSLTTSNLTGTGTDITSPSATFAVYSSECDQAVYSTNTSTFVTKQLVNNQIKLIFGGISNTYLENNSSAQILTFAMNAISSLDTRQGWLAIVGSTVGQRGIILIDMRSDSTFDYSSIISPVFTDVSGTLNFIHTFEQLWDYTNTMLFQYRTTGFNSASGNWNTVAFPQLLNLAIPSTGIQFKVLFSLAQYAANNPAQLAELIIGVTVAGENSDYWDAVIDQTSSGSPTKVGFRLKKAYPSAVPTTLTFRAEDVDGNQVVSESITDQPTKFQYSTNDGVSYTALGTIPNTVGTIVQYTFTSPPGVRIRPSLRDS